MSFERTRRGLFGMNACRNPGVLDMDLRSYRTIPFHCGFCCGLWLFSCFFQGGRMIVALMRMASDAAGKCGKTDEQYQQGHTGQPESYEPTGHNGYLLSSRDRSPTAYRLESAFISGKHPGSSSRPGRPSLPSRRIDRFPGVLLDALEHLAAPQVAPGAEPPEGGCRAEKECVGQWLRRILGEHVGQEIHHQQDAGKGIRYRSTRPTQICPSLSKPAADFLLRRGWFHRRLATTASAFLSTGFTSGGTRRRAA